MFEDKRTVVFENPWMLERAFFVTNIKSASSPEEMGKLLTEKSFNPSKEAVLLNETITTTELAMGKVQIKKYTANEIELKTNSEKNGFLVFADNYDKGWKLLQNGKKAKLYKTNGTLRGIFVPPGENNFKMYYWPDSFDLGLKLSILAGLIFFSGIFITLKKKIF